MRKLVFQSAISVDGFIEGPGGELDWLTSDEASFNARELLTRFDTIFYGRRAYERFGVLPTQEERLTEARLAYYYTIHQMRKYVFSRTEKHLPGNGMVVFENLEAQVKRIREEEGKNIWFCGGADIFKTFAELDLIDEYVLSVHPVVLSAGKPLFAGINKPLNLRLLDKRNLKSGVITLHYQPESRMEKRYHYGRSL